MKSATAEIVELINTDPIAAVNLATTMMLENSSDYVPRFDLATVILAAATEEAIDEVYKKWQGFATHLFKEKWDELSLLQQILIREKPTYLPLFIANGRSKVDIATGIFESAVDSGDFSKLIDEYSSQPEVISALLKDYVAREADNLGDLDEVLELFNPLEDYTDIANVVTPVLDYSDSRAGISNFESKDYPLDSLINLYDELLHVFKKDRLWELFYTALEVPELQDHVVVSLTENDIGLNDFLYAVVENLGRIGILTHPTLLPYLVQNVNQWPAHAVKKILETIGSYVNSQKKHVDIAAALLEHFYHKDVSESVRMLIEESLKYGSRKSDYKLFKGAVQNKLQPSSLLKLLIKTYPELDPSGNDNYMVYLLARKQVSIATINIFLRSDTRIALPQTPATLSKLFQYLCNVASKWGDANILMGALLDAYILPSGGVEVNIEEVDNKAARDIILRDVRISIGSKFARERLIILKEKGITIRDALEQLHWTSKDFADNKRFEEQVNQTDIPDISDDFLELVDMDKQKLAAKLNKKVAYNKKGAPCKLTKFQAILLILAQDDVATPKYLRYVPLALISV